MGNIKHILAFVSFFHTELTLSHNSIRLYLAGIQHFLSLQDPEKSSLFMAHIVRAILQSIQKHQPIAGDTLTHFKCHVPGHVSYPFTVPLQVSAQPGHQSRHLLSFLGFPGTRRVHLQRPQLPGAAQVSPVPPPRSFHTTPGGVQDPTDKLGVDVKLFLNLNEWCRVAVLDKLLMHLFSQSSYSALLPFPTSPLGANQFIKHVRILLAYLGLNLSLYLGHSFRIGAASAASLHGVPDHVIRRLGRWKSAWFSRYIPNPQVKMLQAFTKLAQ